MAECCQYWIVNSKWIKATLKNLEAKHQKQDPSPTQNDINNQTYTAALSSISAMSKTLTPTPPWSRPLEPATKLTTYGNVINNTPKMVTSNELPGKRDRTDQQAAAPRHLNHYSQCLQRPCKGAIDPGPHHCTHAPLAIFEPLNSTMST